METIVLTGFGPFGSHARNISEEAIARLDGTERAGFKIRSVALPVHFESAVACLEEAFVTEPAAVISCGIHDGEGFRVEVAAKNERDYGIPDVEGNCVSGEAVEVEGPAQVFSTLPVSAIKHAFESAGLDAELSDDAGRFLCNAVFYWAARRVTPAGFLHVPADPGRLEDVVTALDLALEATAARLNAQRVEATA